MQVEVLEREKSTWEIEGDSVVKVGLGQVRGGTGEVSVAGEWAGLAKWAELVVGRVQSPYILETSRRMLSRE